MDWMAKALKLAELGRYTCVPNPMVGCIIVKDNQVIGQGAHLKTGGLHAEHHALLEAGAEAKGADVYVTLEPCSHYGHTPPCVDLLIQAGVRTVHIALKDPNPKVNGSGIEKLKNAGIAVYLGEDQEAAFHLNQSFFHFMRDRSPFVIAKWAMSLDGKMATESRHSQWITSHKAQIHAHQLRAQVGGVLVGANTVRQDNPQLTVRHISTSRQPRPIIITTQGHLPEAAHLLAPGSQTLVLTSNQASPTFLRLLERRQIEHVLFPLIRGKFDLPQVLHELGKRRIASILVEGGSTLLTSFFDNQLVNRVYSYIAPKIVGGSHSLSPITGQGIIDMTFAQPLRNPKMISLEPDVCVQADTEITAQSYQEFLEREGKDV
jgi:diaminohydroxyphosphoribosylaminopyrimidine deaminase / 5-amino-6-(5-phosphoribosylamino)uracil reductase